MPPHSLATIASLRAGIITGIACLAMNTFSIAPVTYADPEFPSTSVLATETALPSSSVTELSTSSSPLPASAESRRLIDTAGGFSYIPPEGWIASDTSQLAYGSSLLCKKIADPSEPGQPTPVANDTRIILGKLDQRLYANAEADNAKAAIRLGSDMGEFLMPYQGSRIHQETAPLSSGSYVGGSSYYEVKFTDSAKPIGQLWSGVIGMPITPEDSEHLAERWFVVWLGDANDPINQQEAIQLVESIRPLNTLSPSTQSTDTTAESVSVLSSLP